jgi:multicomponent Na+:H+ antiporter subunit E
MSGQEQHARAGTAGGDTTANGTSGRHLDRAGMSRRWPTLLALVVMWIALWGQLSIANVLGGIVVALAVLMVSREVKPRPVQHLRVVPALRYAVTFTRQLVMASYQVALAVLRPDVKPGIIAVRLQHVSDAIATLVANSITLTPGTLTLEIEREGDTAILYVHALDLSDVDAVRADIAEFEALAVAAFGGAAAQAAHRRRDTTAQEAGTEPATPQGPTGSSEDSS